MLVVKLAMLVWWIVSYMKGSNMILQVWSKEMDTSAIIDNDWKYEIPKKGHFIRMGNTNKKISQIIWDIKNLKVTLIVEHSKIEELEKMIK